MKKFLYPSVAVLLGAVAFIIVSCQKKSPNSQEAYSPTYKDHSTGTAANPMIGVVMVTGTSTLTNPATENSGIAIGGSGWAELTCQSTSSMSLSSDLAGTNTSARLYFASIPSSGTYSLSGSGALPRLEITNAPGQPADITWYSKSGVVTVSVTAVPYNISATFNNVQCLQKKFLFPVVSASGTLSCH